MGSVEENQKESTETGLESLEAEGLRREIKAVKAELSKVVNELETILKFAPIRREIKVAMAELDVYRAKKRNMIVEIALPPEKDRPDQADPAPSNTPYPESPLCIE